MESFDTYIYRGPVMEFGKLVQEKYEAMTVAISPAKAKSNIIFQWKQKNGRLPGSKVTLPGKVEVAR